VTSADEMERTIDHVATGREFVDDQDERTPHELELLHSGAALLKQHEACMDDSRTRQLDEVGDIDGDDNSVLDVRTFENHRVGLSVQGAISYVRDVDALGA
jgi:hypothetical protein